MRLPPSIELGACTHTGRVRSANEDDFLICSPPSPASAEAAGWILALGDGMGGAAGGGEASRAAVRAVVRPVLEVVEQIEAGKPVPPFDEALGRERMRAGFAAAAQQVYALSRESPHLHGMGTTLTVLNLVGERVVLGHVGDTRCALLRGSSWRQLTEDHAVVEPSNYLTRCLGAGQATVDADIDVVQVQPDDRLLLMSDGLWGVVKPDRIATVVTGRPPQAAAEELVRLANRAGGPDNATVLVLAIHSVQPPREGSWIEVELPSEEPPQPLGDRLVGEDLMPPRWPRWILVLGLLALTVGLLRIFLDIDLVARLRAWLD